MSRARRSSAVARRSALLLRPPCFVTTLVLLASVCACERHEEHKGPAPSQASAPAPPRLTTRPDVLDPFPSPSASAEGGPAPTQIDPVRAVLPRRCPPEMVDIAGAFCIDRYEVSLVDAEGGRSISPSYHPTRERVREAFELWSSRSRDDDTALARKLAVPPPPSFELEEDFRSRAVSRVDVIPNGYMSRDTAEQACSLAGKRLCTQPEWVRACRGQSATQFPYGPRYVDGQCNVHREAHPAQLLHGNASIHHTDPRLPLVKSDKGALLRKTGETTTCASRWGDDAVYDMVGNLDEWIDDPGGTFVGGFFSRATRDGCESVITVHAPSYFDYSLGTRCCRDEGPWEYPREPGPAGAEPSPLTSPPSLPGNAP